MADKKVFEFRVEGVVDLDCAAGCGRPAEYAIIAIPIRDKIDAKDFPKISVCSQCKVAHNDMPNASQTPESLDRAFGRGVQLGGGIVGAIFRAIEVLTVTAKRNSKSS